MALSSADHKQDSSAGDRTFPNWGHVPGCELTRGLELQSQMAELERQTAELRSNLAELTMPGRMLELAFEMGFRPAEMGDIIYVVVPEYQSGEPFVAPSPPTSLTDREGGLSPAYTETLGEWMSRWLRRGIESSP